MPQACRNALRQERVDRSPASPAAHAGLLLARYLEITVGDKEDHPEKRLALLKAAQGAARLAQPLYKIAYDHHARWLTEVPACTWAMLKIVGRMIIGLGSESALETGLTLHHTYGVPIIPGSALKGLAAHYCDQVWANAEDGREFAKRIADGTDASGKTTYRFGQYYEFLYGKHDDAGHIQFYDAWITPDSLSTDNQGLVDDVMTPHHREYYAGDSGAAPTDNDDPNPIRFLAAAGTFHVAVSCDVEGDKAEKWANLALQLLKNTLQHWGIGGKTSSGYGRLVEDEEATKSLQRKLNDTMLAALPEDERARKIVAGWTLDVLARKIGKEWNPTLRDLNIDAVVLRNAILAHSDVAEIQGWNKCGETNKEKTWKRIFGQPTG